MRTTLPRVMPKYRATGSLNWMRGSCVSLTCGSMAQGTGVGRVVGPHVARLRSCQVAQGVKRGHRACFGATAWLPGRITDWDGGLPLLLAPRPRATSVPHQCSQLLDAGTAPPDASALLPLEGLSRQPVHPEWRSCRLVWLPAFSLGPLSRGPPPHHHPTTTPPTPPTPPPPHPPHPPFQSPPAHLVAVEQGLLLLLCEDAVLGHQRVLSNVHQQLSLLQAGQAVGQLPRWVGRPCRSHAAMLVLYAGAEAPRVRPACCITPRSLGR